MNYDFSFKFDSHNMCKEVASDFDFSKYILNETDPRKSLLAF